MADFHLFDKFYGSDLDDAGTAGAAGAEYLHKWVEMLGLSGKVESAGSLPVTELSTGQKKRMALLAAIMEKRDVLLLDEVAADFDPYFREKYYKEILPALKKEGRTLFVISHDDRYYDIADRVLTMREGGIEAS
jgi:ABC-type siderophore export system fused ATPase/permease subunit